MPLFADLGLLFVHIPKNAGRSIEKVLLGDHGTPDGGRRSIANRAARLLLQRTRSKFAERYLIGTIDEAFAAQHLTYSEMDLLGLLPTDERSYHSFAVVRNPYDRVLSSIMHFSADAWVHEADETLRKRQFEFRLAEWLERQLDDHNKRAHRRMQIEFLRDQTGKRSVDSILRFEAISEEFTAFMEDRGRPGLALPMRGHAGRTRNYSDYFNASSRLLVEKVFGEDIETFGYSF